MAMSGQLVSTENNSYNHEVLVFNWSAEYNADNTKAVFTLNAYIRIPNNAPYPNRAYAVYGDASSNYIKIEGVIDPDNPGATKTETVFSTTAYGSGTWSDPYNGYANYMKENGTNRHTDGKGQYENWEGHPNAWVYIHTRPLIDKTVEVPLNDDGVATCYVSVLLTDYGGSYTMRINRTAITTSGTPADIFSKVKTVKNSTGNWADGGYVWLKENSGWKKKKMYRKDTNTGTASDWVKK